MKTFSLFALAFLLSACGYKFVDRADVNISVPTYYSERDFYKKGAEAIGNNLEQIAGRVMTFNSTTNTYQLTPFRVVNTGGAAIVEAIQDANVYSSVINNGYQANSNFPFVTASTEENLVKEYEIRDIARARIPATQIPSPTDIRTRLGGSVAPTAKVYWVEGAVLTTIRERGYRKIESNGNVSGTGFGIAGKAYGSSDATTNTYVISLLLLEIPPIGQVIPGASMPFGQGYLKKLPRGADGLSVLRE